MTTKKNIAPVENIGIKIGVDFRAVQEARDTILKILASGAEQETIRVALKVLTEMCSVNGNSISNCCIEMGSSGPKPQNRER